jgi:exosortase
LNSSPVSASADSRSGVASMAVSPWILVALLAFVWLPAIRQWSYDWSTNPQYYYGWAVPLLAAYLAYERWETRPAARPLVRFWVFLPLVGLAALQLPVRWFGEANSDWWPVWWAYGTICVGVTLGLLALFGGAGWVRHFLYPCLFMFTAIPWPTYFEISVVQRLMGINAAISAEIVSALGAPAIAVGNVIEVSSGVLGVNEACSGIRSLQSTLMAAFFLAGLYQLRSFGIALLAGVGVLIAFTCNIIRTTFLTYEGATKGVEATEKWHDTAGFVILGVVLVCLFFISQFLDRRTAARNVHR